jgi:serine/threonine protein kinase, bacterial
MFGISGKYRLDQRLGGGGMAEVFLGSTVGAEGFSRPVAIKRVLPGFSDNPAFAQMFVAEAQISARLVHPNIVSVIDFDRDDENRLFLVMELVEGRDLDALVSTGLLPFPVVIYVIAEVLRGLGHAHDLPVGSGIRGIVHRDVSPHNVLLSWDGSVKVSDFGIAKARAASEATASVFIKGKPAYMSPEQANGESLDGRSDLFAVGIMLWEMVVGRRLFVGEDTRATLASVLFGQVPRPRSLRPEIPKDLERVVMKLLERDLPARYATAEDAIHDLLECHDAPKAGRELLARTLAERFPQHAPVRQSSMRSRNTPPQAQTPAPQTTLPDGSIGRPPAAAVPSLGAMMSAPTGTLGRAPNAPRRGKAALLVGAALASAAAAFGVVMIATSSTKHGSGAGSGSDSGSGSGSGSAPIVAVNQPTGPDSGMPDAPSPALPPPIDAGVPDATAPDAKKDASSTHSSHPGPDKGMGSVEITALPSYLSITIDNTPHGDTPKTIPLPAGPHKLKLVNENGFHETTTIHITANKTLHIDRRTDK